jgi:uncharacterized protein YjbI with pentapeptide repeats
MANPAHEEILKQGVDKWNRWRNNNPEIKPDLSKIDLSRPNFFNDLFQGFVLIGDVLVSGEIFRNPGKRIIETGNKLNFIEPGKNLTGVNFTETNLTRANLIRTNLTGVKLTRANLAGAKLASANLTEANLTGACIKNWSGSAE